MDDVAYGSTRWIKTNTLMENSVVQ